MSTKSLMASFTADMMSPVVCSAPYGGYLYVAGADGIVYSTVDGSYYDEFWRVDDGSVMSLGVYGDALFVGTSPEGSIYMHNFSTGNRFHYATTGDHAVTRLTEHDGVLYAGTSRSGVILSFDGDEWRKEFEALRSVSSMESYSGSLYVFFSDSSSVLAYNGKEWKFMFDGESIFTVGGNSPALTSLPALAGGQSNDSGVSLSAVVGDKIFFSGTDRATVYSFDGSAVTIEYQFGEGLISSLSSSENQLFVSIGDTVYVNVEEEDKEVTDGESQ